MGKAKALFVTILLGVVAALAPNVALAEPGGPLAAHLTSDRDTYGAGDTATFTLVVDNSGAKAVRDVAYHFELPEGTQLIEGAQPEGSFDVIEAGDDAEAIVHVTLPAHESESPTGDEGETLPPDDDTQTTPNDPTGTTDTTDPADTPETTNDGLPATGDAFAASIAALAIGGLVALVVGRHLHDAHVSALLIGGITLTALLASAAIATTAHAADSTQTLTCEKTVSVDGSDLTVQATVTYAVEEEPEEPDPDETAPITRGEWIAQLLDATGTGDFEADPAADAACPFTDIAESPYAEAIKTAYALGSLPDDVANEKTFSPDEPATRDFMLSTAVLHVGFYDTGATLESSDAADADHPSLLQVALDQGIAELDENGALRPQDAATVSEANEVAGRVAALDFDADAPTGGDPVVNYELQDDVILLDACEQVDEDTFALDIPYNQASTSETQQSDVSTARRAARSPFRLPAVGGKVAYLGDDKGDEGFAGTVLSIYPNDDGTRTLFDYDQATTPDEIYQSIEVTATDQGKRLANVEPVDGATVIPSDGAASQQDGHAIDISGEDGFTISFDDLKIEDAGSVSGSVNVIPSIDVDFDWEFPTTINRARAVVNLDTTVNVTADFDGVDKTVDLLKHPITVPIASGANVAFDLKLHIKADGSAELNVEFDQKIGARYRNGAFQKVSKTVVDEKNTHCAVRAEFALGAVPIAQLRFTKIDLFDVSAELGGAGDGEAITRTTGITCIDADAYVYGSLSVGTNTGWMKWAELTYTKDVWQKGSTPFEGAWHFENTGENGALELVDECTQKDVPGSDATPAEDFEYTVEDDGVHIERYIGDDTEVIIPANIEGKPVVYACLGVESSLSGMYPKANNVERVSLEEGSQLVEFRVWDESQGSGVGNWEYKLDSFDTGDAEKLKVIFLGDDRPIELMLGNSPDLREIHALPTNNLDLRQYRYLETVELSSTYRMWDNLMSELKLGDHPNLTRLYVFGTDISELDLSGCPNLTVLDIGRTPIEALDLSACTHLEELWCDECSLTALDVSRCPELTLLSIDSPSLTTLKLDNPKLEDLLISDTDLSELDLSSCPELTTLICVNSPIGELNLSVAPKLESLNCDSCNLTELDVSMLSNLTSLGCSDNQLTELDLSGCPLLNTLDCEKNQLTSLDISVCPNLRFLHCKGNPIEDTSALEEWFQNGGQGEM